MSDLLKLGQSVPTSAGPPCTVVRLLGSGGQGQVFHANWQGKDYALKWYYPHQATADQRASLSRLIHEGPPSEAFLWPLTLATSPDAEGFGYVMRLREPRFKNLVDLMRNRVDPSFRELVTFGMGLVDSFRQLHAKGLCYRDISFGNAFFDPLTGEALICDNDNVAPNRSGLSGVLGTPDFMAPEIVRGEAEPSRQTDLFSLSVLLFYIFHINHPLMGKKVQSIRAWDLPARQKMFGKEPVFIFDPQDRSNEAVDDPLGEAGTHARKYWPIYPQSLRDSFVQAFTEGVRDAEHGRVVEGQWLRVLSRMRDAIYICPACSTQNFYDESRSPQAACWQCRASAVLPYRMRIDKTTVMLNADAKLHGHHFDAGLDLDFEKAAAEVVRHPSDPRVWGLKNLTGAQWVATMPDGTLKDVPPGKSVPLRAQVRVNFGKIEGEILY